MAKMLATSSVVCDARTVQRGEASTAVEEASTGLYGLSKTSLEGWQGERESQQGSQLQVDPSVEIFLSCLFVHVPLGEEEPQTLPHSPSESRAQPQLQLQSCRVFPAPFCLFFPRDTSWGRG